MLPLRHGLLVLAAGLLSACIPREQVTLQQVGDLRLVSTTAGNNLSVMRGDGADATLCLRLGPDTASDRSGGFIGGLGTSGSSEQVGGTESDAEVELIGRTPAVVLTRDTLFQLCLLHQNGLISDAQYVQLLQVYLNAGFDLAARETEVTEIRIGEGDTNYIPPLGGSAVPLSFGTAVPAPASAPAPAPAPTPTAANPL